MKWSLTWTTLIHLFILIGNESDEVIGSFTECNGDLDEVVKSNAGFTSFENANGGLSKIYNVTEFPLTQS